MSPNKYNQHLVDNALWLVMDPWQFQPTRKDNPQEVGTNQNSINDYFSELIAWRLKAMTHKCISCWEYRNDREMSRYFDDYLRLHDVNAIEKYCQANDIDSIVYTGFHFGRCVDQNKTGARVMQAQGYDTYLALDLVCGLKIKEDLHSIFADVNFEHYFEKSLPYFKEII